MNEHAAIHAKGKSTSKAYILAESIPFSFSALNMANENVADANVAQSQRSDENSDKPPFPKRYASEATIGIAKAVIIAFFVIMRLELIYRYKDNKKDRTLSTLYREAAASNLKLRII